MFNTKLLSNKKGTSLVEILVTMSVLAIGILIVYQMFPSGFSIIKMAESRTTASFAANAEMERWKNRSDNMPEGITIRWAWNDADNKVLIDSSNQIIDGQYPALSSSQLRTFIDLDNNDQSSTGTLNDFDDDDKMVGVDGSSIPGFVRGNVLNMRQVLGEKTYIPVGSYYSTGWGNMYGARYQLSFAPIDVYQDSVSGKAVGISVKSSDMRRRISNSDHYPPALTPFQYAIDYADGDTDGFNIAFPASTNGATFYVSYSYWKPNGTTADRITVFDEPVVNVGGWIFINCPGVIVPFSETCARGFDELVPDPANSGNTTQVWSSNPYEYVVADPLLGIIAFNPAAHSIMEPTPQGLKPIVARIDYRIYDPRIINENKIVPTAEVGSIISSIKLNFKYILNAGAPTVYNDGEPTDNPGEETFEGLMRAQLENGISYPTLGKELSSDVILLIASSIYIVDEETGLRVQPVDSAGNTLIESEYVDYGNGAINFPVASDNSIMCNLMDYQDNIVSSIDLTGRNLRIMYRVDGDFALSCMKPYYVYRRETSAPNPDPTANIFSYKTYRYNQDSNSNITNELLFDLMYIGQTVAVDYTYIDPSGVEYKVSGESHQISDVTSKFAVANGGDDREYAPITLNIPNGSTLGSVYAVAGSSFKVRVMWRDRTRWHYIDKDTTIMRKPG